MTRPIYEIAGEIRKDWYPVNYAAVPYLRSMLELDKITDKDWCDSAEGIVARFLGNAGTWRGETARRVKAELRGMLK